MMDGAERAVCPMRGGEVTHTPAVVVVAQNVPSKDSESSGTSLSSLLPSILSFLLSLTVGDCIVDIGSS